MSNRVLKHYRFGRTFARINRTLRSRRKKISKIMALYKKFGLVSGGCSLCKSKNFTLVSEGDRYGFDLKKQLCNECFIFYDTNNNYSFTNREYFSPNNCSIMDC